MIMTLPKDFKPNLSSTYKKSGDIKFPVLASPKIDGFRCTIFGGVAYTRSLKTIPNRYVAEQIRKHAQFLEGMDCEITVGNPNDPKVFENTSGPIRRESGEPDFLLHVFDLITCHDGVLLPLTATERDERLGARIERAMRETKNLPPFVRYVQQAWVCSQEELDKYETECVNAGYEGVITKGTSSQYKFGRSTLSENGYCKVKRYEDCEIVVIDTEEEMKNNNVATVNELGRTARSSHKANKEGKNTLGKLIGICLNGSMKGSEVSVGSGFKAEQRKKLWDRKSSLPGSIVTIKFFPVGSKDAPRHPTFLRFRLDEDVSPKMRELADKTFSLYEGDALLPVVNFDEIEEYAVSNDAPVAEENEDFGSW